jgi:hypothetical protein
MSAMRAHVHGKRSITDRRTQAAGAVAATGHRRHYTRQRAGRESVEVLRSEPIANAVIDTLDLTHDPEFRVMVGSDGQRQRAILDTFERALTVRRIGQSYVIEVSFSSAGSAKAAASPMQSPTRI